MIMCGSLSLSYRNVLGHNVRWFSRPYYNEFPHFRTYDRKCCESLVSRIIRSLILV